MSAKDSEAKDPAEPHRFLTKNLQIIHFVVLSPKVWEFGDGAIGNEYISMHGGKGEDSRDWELWSSERGRSNSETRCQRGKCLPLLQHPLQTSFSSSLRAPHS